MCVCILTKIVRFGHAHSKTGALPGTATATFRDPMAKALLVIGASAVSIDWDVRVGYSTMPDSSIPGGPGHNSSDGQMEPLGKTATWQKCEDLCANDTKCISFDYHGPVGRNWDRWCYKRINYQFPVIKEAKTRVCGWKNGPAPGPPAPSPGPGPGPAPTPSPDAFISRFSCAMRKLARRTRRLPRSTQPMCHQGRSQPVQRV